MNNAAMAPGNSTPLTEPTNSVAMTQQTSSAQLVHRPIAQWIMRARCDRISNSALIAVPWTSVAVGNSRSSARNRSTTRPSRLTSTVRIAPTPVSRKTGATAS
jgi:hypothetical protein